MYVINCVKGVSKCMCGVVGFPLYVGASLIAGTAYTISATTEGECCYPSFCEKREQICACCGIGTGFGVSIGIMLSGMTDLTKPYPVTMFPYFDDETCARVSPYPRVLHDMER
jgi:hypothetical protein